MSILYLAGKRKRVQKNFMLTITLFLVLLMGLGFPSRALAGGIGDVVTGVVNANFSSTEFDFSSEDRTGLNIGMHAGMGEYGDGGGGVTVLGPTDAAGMRALLKYVDGEAKHTSIQTARMKGAEVREYTMEHGVGVGVVLPDYFITVELYMTGNSSASDIAKAKAIAQQTLYGLERSGLLSQAAPDIEKATPAEEEQPDAPAAPDTGKPLDEPVKISDTMNIARVYNGPTVPTTFSINRPHLVTFITTYHWNNARGAAGGTIALRGSDGKVYGPWKVSTRPGQGGVPNAYWEVSPNVVIPAGTYTVIDSDPATWSQNQQSGGRGMCEVKATPNFEAAGNSSSAAGKRTADPSAGSGWTPSPAGVGSVGNIPGPSNTTEAVVGVAVPGLIATGLGALAGLGGGGGFAPPGGAPLSPAGGGSWPGGGGSAAGAGAQRSVTIQEAGQLGRRRYEPDPLSGFDIRVDTAEMSQGAIGVSPRDGLIIETADEAGIFVRPEPEIIIDTAWEEPGVIRPDSGILSGETGSGILLDTSALEGEILAGGELGAKGPGAAEEAIELIEENAYDQEGYDQAGFDQEGFNREGFDRFGYDREGFNKEGFDRAGFNKEGFNKAGFNAEGFDKEGYNREGFDRAGFNRDGFNKEGFDRAGFDKAGFDARGFDQEGYDQAGFDQEGFNREGFDRSGFDREGFNKEGYDRAGFNKEGFNKAGFNAEGFDKEGYNRAGFDQEGFNREGFNRFGFDREGFNKEGYDRAGFNKEGFNKSGFNAEGFDKEGYNRAGFDQEGFNREGFNRSGFDREGFNKEGFNQAGFDKEGFDKAGFDAQGYDREGFNKVGFDREGYGRNGFDQNGYDREGYDVNGYNQKGYNRSGYDAKGYSAQGYDRDGFDKAGFDREGYDRNGLNKEGYDRQGFDKDGYDREGYNREGFDKDGRQRDGSDEYGYGKDGFNENGFDKDGYDREGFNYEGYNRGGYDPWGYNKQGYDKDGYHWSGYNADGYNRSGRHWSENPYEGDSPFNVDVSNAQRTFGEGKVIPHGAEVSEIEWKPEKPPLGEPYPKTLEKYGAKPWADEIPQAEPEKPPVPQPEDSGVIGPEDPMNTLKQHGLDKDTPATGQEDVPIPVAEAERPDGSEFPEDGLPPAKETPSLEYGTPGFPQDGEKRILVGKTDGRSIELEYDGKTGEWINTESGNIVDPDRFEQWQNDLAEDRRRAAEDLEKMIQRQDAHSQAIDQNLEDWKRLEQMQKAAEKYGVGEKGGPGDVDKAIQKLKDDMLAGKEIDRERMEQINEIIDNRITGATAADTGERWEEVPWYKDLESALKANLETAREVVTGEKADGSISWMGMGARVAIGAATGGASEYVMTVAEAMHRINDSIQQGETGFRAVAKAIGQLILEEAGGELIGAAGGKAMQNFADAFPNFTQKAGDMAEKIGLAVAAGDQIASHKLGLISKRSAEEALADLAKQMDDIGAGGLRKVLDEKIADAGLKVASADDLAKAFGKGTAAGTDDLGKAIGKAATGGSDDVVKGTGGHDLSGQKAAGAADDAADAAGKTAPVDRPTRGARSEAEVLNDPQAVAKAEKSLQKNMDDFDKLPEVKKQELIKEQAKYDEYRLQAEEKNWELADKVRRGEELSVDDVLKLKSDPAAMRKLKEIQEIDGLGAELGDRGAKNVQIKYNETLNKNVYEPSYKNVQDSLKDKYGEVRVETVRTPGKEYHPWDVNTDNDIIALRKVVRNGKEEWVEIPRSEWEDTYFKSYAQNTGFDPRKAGKKFPNEDWAKMTPEEQYRKWGELHGESPTDVYHPEGARDFSTQRTSILDGQAPDKAAAAQAAKGQGKLLDPEQLGMMERNKIDHYWAKGDIKSQTEAMEQLRKASSQAQNLEQGYKSMGYKIQDMPENMKKAIDVVNDNSLSPATRAARLEELGYDSPGDFVDKLTSRIGSLRAARK